MGVDARQDLQLDVAGAVAQGAGVEPPRQSLGLKGVELGDRVGLKAHAGELGHVEKGLGQNEDDIGVDGVLRHTLGGELLFRLVQQFGKLGVIHGAGPDRADLQAPSQAQGQAGVLVHQGLGQVAPGQGQAHVSEDQGVKTQPEDPHQHCRRRQGPQSRYGPGGQAQGPGKEPKAEAPKSGEEHSQHRMEAGDEGVGIQLNNAAQVAGHGQVVEAESRIGDGQLVGVDDPQDEKGQAADEPARQQVVRQKTKQGGQGEKEQSGEPELGVQHGPKGDGRALPLQQEGEPGPDKPGEGAGQKEPAPHHRPARDQFLPKVTKAFHRSLKRDTLGDVVPDLSDGDTHLLHGVPLPDGDAVVGGGAFLGVAYGVEVEGDTEGGADLVLAAVALADGAGVVIVHHKVGGQLLVELPGGAGEDLLFGQGQDGALKGSQGGVKAKDHPHVVLLGVHHLFVIGVAEDGKDRALHAQRGLDDVGDIVLVLVLVVVGQVLARGVLVLGQVVVGAVGHAPQLAPAEGEEELKVGGGFGVEAQLLGVVVPQAQVLVLQTDGQKPVVAELPPVLEPLLVGARLAEELQLHLLKLPDPEDEVARGDLVAEGLADLADAEGELAPGGTLDIDEVGKNALSGLRPEVDGIFSVLGDPLEGLEHQVELADIGKVVLAAGGAGDVMLLHELLHLRLGEGVDGLGQVHALLVAVVLNELVRPEALVALAAVHQGVGEAGQMARGHPGLGVHQNGGVQTHVVGVLLDKFLPPGPFDVVFQLRAQGAVVPGVGQAAVDLGPGEDKAPALAQGDDLFHGFFTVVHSDSLPVGFRLYYIKKSLSLQGGLG